MMQVTIVADVTPENAPLLAQLLTGGASKGAVTPALSLDSADTTTYPATTADPPAPEEEPPADDATPAPEELGTQIRAKCIALKKAGKNDLAHAAIKSVGYESFSKVPKEKYPELWEALKDAG